MEYIKCKQDLKEFLEYESEQYSRKNTNIPLFAIKEKDVLYKLNYLLRKTEYAVNCNKISKNIWKLRLRLYENKYEMTIPINVFDKGVKFVHIGPRLVNGNAKVGKNCVMHINTAIVAGRN